MTAAAILTEAERAGVRLHLDGGTVRLTADTRPCSNLLAELRRHRDGVAELLMLRATSDMDHDACEAAAMAEHYAAPVSPAPEPRVRDVLDAWFGSPPPVLDRDALTDGLLAGYRQRPSTPSPETAPAVASGLHHHG